MNVAGRAAGWLPGIDILRATAALAVIVDHSIQQGFGDAVAQSAIGQLIWWLGAWGVTLFFVLSGFCIHLPHARRLAANPEARVDWGPFYRRRAFRLLAPHYGALVIAAIVGYYIPTNLIGAPTVGTTIAHVFFLHTLFGAVTF